MYLREQITIDNNIQLVRDGRLIYFATTQDPDTPNLEYPMFLDRVERSRNVFAEVKKMAGTLREMPITYWTLALERAATIR
jgi:hypothetical protein